LLKKMFFYDSFVCNLSWSKSWRWKWSKIYQSKISSLLSLYMGGHYCISFILNKLSKTSVIDLVDHNLPEKKFEASEWMLSY
jgi:hypothetical protein